MASEEIIEAGAALTANGGTDGYLTVADTTPFYPGAFAWLSSSTKNQYVQITDIKSATQLGVRFCKAPNEELTPMNVGHSSGRSDCSGFTTAQSARIDMPSQVVRVYQPQFTKFPRG